jgi:uncharacterized protein (TIGR02646 family)
MGIGSMKRVLKGVEPRTLIHFKNAVPTGTWEQMKDDPYYQGRQAYQDCRSQCIADQGGICAYCEIGIHDNDPLKCRVEHFHPKSDITTTHNWALDWQNMFGVCNGGSNPYISDPRYHKEPISKNLSCDAYKDRMITEGKLPQQCEGLILNPLQLEAFPSLFRIDKMTGFLHPDSAHCSALPPIPNNQHATIESLVQHTIDMLNLNCDRLAEARKKIIFSIEHDKKTQRDRGFSAQTGLNNLAQKYFQTHWRNFFTTIRLCIGPIAENYLNHIHYQG